MVEDLARKNKKKKKENQLFDKAWTACLLDTCTKRAKIKVLKLHFVQNSMCQVLG